MIILRTGLFSSKKSKKEESRKESKRKTRKDALIGAGVAGGGLAGNIAAINDLAGKESWVGNEKMHPGLKKENEQMWKKLAEKAEAQGTKVHKVDSPATSHYSPKASSLHKEVGKSGDYIRTGNSGEIFAHELGHSQYYKKGRAKGVEGAIGRGMHKASVPGRVLGSNPLGMAASFANGYHSGKKSKKLEREGKKESAWNKHKSWAVPAAIMAPVVISEGMASRKGYKMLKQAGASKEYLKQSRKTLAKAGGSYAGAAAFNVGLGQLGRAAGRHFE